MQRIANAFVTMATFVAEQDPTSVAQQAILSLPMTSSSDLSTATYTWNDSAPEKPFPPPQTVAATVFHAINGHATSSIAVEEAASGVSYTYLELSNTSSCIASAIQSVCKNNQNRVALIFNQGFAMYTALLGVLSAGGCIVPIDAPNTPVDRVLFMLRDAEADLVIFDDANKDFVRQIKEKGGTDQEAAFVYMSYRDILEAGTTRIENHRPIVNVNSDSVAYILYTSGTTGQAKGVMISHANIHNMIHWWISLIDLNRHDKVLHFSSFSFVMSLRQIFPVFVAGATVVAPRSGAEFESAIRKCQVTKMALTPSALSTLNHGDYSSLRVIQVAGEACPLKLANEWASRLEAFFIGLGPTELTGHACCGKFRVGDRVNIGFPVSNTAVYILNEAGEIQPPGVIGELCVAGENVSSGYLKRDELTKKHFVANKFDSSKPKMYKVGDLARRLEDGRIEFVGREDDQVKVRGFR
jgi:amino acid adenylation domain-containing protein